MAELLKNIYNDGFFDVFMEATKDVVPEFDVSSFLDDVHDNEWKERELKQRMRHITTTFYNHLKRDYEGVVKVLLKSIPRLLHYGFKPDNLEFIFYPDIIEMYGQEHYDTSINAIEQITQFVTCEFAIRPFIIADQDKTLQHMLLWSGSDSIAVRRLSSEGCRPRLPWAMALPALKKDPKPILPILENLKNDGSEYVRRSVANNLNDISKDHPELVIQIAKAWIGQSKETDSLVKHACRTLLKQGNNEVMEMFGFGSINNVDVTEFKVLTPAIKIGDSLEFSFNLKNTGSTDALIRIEYGVYYQKANGSLSRKVFKISERTYPSGQEFEITRKQSFKVISTRKYHLGLHQVSLILNGNELEKLDFELT